MATVSLIALHWKRQGEKLKISIQKTDVGEIVNCLHILGNEPYFQVLLFIISDLRKCPCPIRASREKWKCPIRATFCPIRASRFGVNRPNFAKRNNTSRGEVRKKWEAGWKITRQLHDYYIRCENSDTPQSESSSRQGKRQDESPQERQKTFNSIGESQYIKTIQS